MAKLTPLAPDSAGFKVLSRLYAVGGTSTAIQLLDVLWGGFRTEAHFIKVAQAPLLLRGLISVETRPKSHDYIHITLEGRAVVECYERSLQRPRAATIMNSHLNLAKHFAARPSRAGADDYRKIPSLMSGERVPYRGNEPDAGEGNDG